MRLFSNLDADQNAVINIPLDPRPQPPASPVFGQIYTNSTDKNIKYWDGTKWIILGTIREVVNSDGSISVSTNAGVVDLNLNLDNATLEIGAGVVRIKDQGVTTAKLKDGNVTTVKILDKNITFAKINDIPTMTVVGRTDGGTGVSSAIPIINTNDLTGANGVSLVTSGAVKAYVDSAVAGLGRLIGGYDAKTNTVFPGTTATKKGDFWYVTVVGSIQGVPFQIGDVIVANKDNPANTNANDYIFLQTNADQATTTILGMVMLATDSEVQEGIENTKAITSAGLSSRTATETRTGIAKISTSAQAIEGKDDTTIMTPKKVKEVLATVTNKGYSAVFGTTALEYFVTHGLNTMDIIAEFFEQPSNKKCLVDYTVIDATKIGVYFGKAPGANSLKVVIIPKG
ncbi:MAG: hypothetical protein LBE34_12585 [Flavobacteriaceae bacterium]|jgi:hypothetical protein|nr:hypothetical protein [Flavobacteriaceae bacterium]